jgi:hypothetical protein
MFIVLIARTLRPGHDGAGWMRNVAGSRRTPAASKGKASPGSAPIVGAVKYGRKRLAD